MRTHGVEVLPPRFDHHLRLGSGAEPIEAQAFIAEFAVETFRCAILSGLARIDQCRADTLANNP